MPRLYYYTEVYNTESAASEGGEYSLLTYIAEANRQGPLDGFFKRTRRIARTPDVLVGSFDISTLRTGSYFLRFVLLDEGNEAQAEQSRKFFVFNPVVLTEAPVDSAVPFEMTADAMMPEEEVEKSLEHIEIIATEAEWNRARSIQDLDEKRHFLMEFWWLRDPDPSTPSNEFREDFYGRLQYANERYSVGGTEGWQTDRGRTLIKYGPPTAIEPHLYDRGYKPYELWEFSNIPGEGQALFVFADINGFGEFELIHSTVAGERKLANWRQELTDSLY